MPARIVRNGGRARGAPAPEVSASLASARGRSTALGRTRLREGLVALFEVREVPARDDAGERRAVARHFDARAALGGASKDFREISASLGDGYTSRLHVVQDFNRSAPRQ